MVTKLQKERAFVGQNQEQRLALETSLKERYNVSDYETPNGLGYKINDMKRKKDSYFSPNSRLTLEKRYLEKESNKKVIENVLDLFARVSTNIAEADLKYNPEADLKPIAEGFLESMIHQEFMPNTPTLCNAGRPLQQLSACFVLPVEDYMATDDIGEDPEKQGNGIYDAVRYMTMIHKSGGGTGFNFSHLRPRADGISTTFGTSSGPVSFIKGGFDSATNAVNQGGFRRGANMGILNFNHPDIFEFVSEKARNGTLKNFNLSVGITDEFMKLVETNGYFKLINPKGEYGNVPLEKKVWKAQNLLQKGTLDYDQLYGEIQPSLIISKDGKTVINNYNEKEVGKVEEGIILIKARSLFDDIKQYAWEEGCPGIIFLDRLEERNTTPHVGKIEATNPCGEQPLLPFEACNLGAINLASCVKKNLVDYEEITKRTRQGVHFLDNVVDMSKFPFQKIYGMVHGNRKIGLGLMGWAEMLTQLSISYDSQVARNLAKKISEFVTETGRTKSEELAEIRGVFPNWNGSVWEKKDKRVRNATITTIAPNGTTGMISDCNGGIEPYFKLAFQKTCMDGRKLIYRNPLLLDELKKRFQGQDLEKILFEVDKKGSIQEINKIPEELKEKFKTAHDISSENHIKMQAAFQYGIDNAVSKTVNMPETATIEDIGNTYVQAYKEGCVGITIFRDNSKTGVLSGLDTTIQLIQKHVDSHPVIDIKAQAIKYRIKRLGNGDSLHFILTSDIYVNDSKGKAFFIPDEIFQDRIPLGDATTVSFQQAGIDRTGLLKAPNPDYTEMIKRLQSPTSNESEGMGPRRIKSIEHAAGLVLEDYLLRNGVVEHDKHTNKLYNVVKKADLRKVEPDTDEFKKIISQVRIDHNGQEVVMGTNGKLGKKFVCESCGGVEFIFEAGCHHPKCTTCGEIEGGGCG